MIKELVRNKVNTVDKQIREMAKMFEDLDIELEKGPDGHFRPKPKDMSSAAKRGSKIINNIDASTLNVQKLVVNNNNSSNEMPADYQKLLDENENLKLNEREAREEVQRLQDVIRKYRMMMKFKEVLTAERNEFKIDNLRQ